MGLSHVALEVGMGHLSNTDMLEVCGVDGAPGVWGTRCTSGPVCCSLVQGTRHDPVDHGRLVEEPVHMPMVVLLCIGDQGEV